MRKKLFPWLSFLIVFSLALQSCVHDEISTASDPASKEYTNKSLWKEDEKYIKNVMKVFDEYADKSYFASNFGEVYWNYATTMGTYDEKFLEVPVVKNGKINFILLVYRENDRILFKRKDEESSKEFFKILVFTDRVKNKLSGRILGAIGNTSKSFCYTVETTVEWTNDDGSQGPTFSHSETHCVPTGPSLPCQAIDTGTNCGGAQGNSGSGGSSGGSPTGYPYPQTQNPCAKLKAQTTNTTFKNNITTLEGKTGDGYESGYRIGTNSDGSIQNQLLQNKQGTQQVDLKAFSNTVTIMHSHYDGLYPIFSPGDIIFFNQWVVWAQNWNSVPTNNPKIPLNNLTFTLVTSNGNYSFNFDGTSATPLPNYTQQQLEDLDRDYTYKYLNNAVTVGNVSGNANFNMDKLETEFLKFMNDKMNMDGLKLYKTTTSGNSSVTLVNGTRQETNCPN